MRRLVRCALLGVACVCLALPASAAGEDKGERGADQGFVMKASGAGLAEVSLSEIAKRNAANADVKQFAERMVKDHTKANVELAKLAGKKKLKVARGLDEKHAEVRNRLLKLMGAEFDRAYMDVMVKDHQEAVALFEKESKDGKDDDLKAWAEKTLPTLKEHRKMAKEVAGKLKGGGGTPGK
jgi:putative membrane protein